MVYIKQYDSVISAIMTKACVFKGEELKQGEVPAKRFFIQNAAWDTGAEVTIISPCVVQIPGIQPFEKKSLMGIGGDEEVGVYRINLVS